MVPVRNALREFSDSSGPKMHLKFKQSFYRKLFAEYARAAQEYCDSKDKVLYHLLVCGLLKVLYRVCTRDWVHYDENLAMIIPV